MTKARHEVSLDARPVVEREALPLAVLTVIIDKKRISPAVYKQIAEEDVIDGETGDLRGTPVGYFNIHPAAGCPQAAHRHVLWGVGTRVRLATVVPRQNDLRYRQMEHASRLRTNALLNLLSLVLVGGNRPYTLEEATRDSVRLKSAGYTLSLSGITAEVLLLRERALAQLEEDKSALLAQEEQVGANSAPVAGRDGEHLQGAEAALLQISELGMEVAHPVLYRYENEENPDWSTLRMLQGWHAYPSERSDERHAALLYWRSRDHAQRRDRERLAPSIEPHLASHAWAIRVLLVERMLRQQDQKIRERAAQLANDTNALAADRRRTEQETGAQRDAQPLSLEAFDPARVWTLYEQEQTRLQDVARLWDNHLAMINELEQLFLIS